MNRLLTALTPFERRLLRVAATLVPRPQREDWRRTWHAELWDMHHRRLRRRGPQASRRLSAGLSAGLLRDALWLRTHSWQLRLSGTATLCIASLLALCGVAAMLSLALQNDWHSFAPILHAQLMRSLVAAPLVLFVAFATGPRRHLGPSFTRRHLFWVRRQLFLSAKTALVLLLSLLLSADAAYPIHAHQPATADLLQIFFFVLCAVVGLRWVFADQEQRCKHCLHALASPARVGRPSHNLLEWNGTELACKHGHGQLNIPEMQTSWCEFNQWVELIPPWDSPASI